jgi:hypothetical protein
VTVIQRASSDMKLNPHLHAVAVDGAYLPRARRAAQPARGKHCWRRGPTGARASCATCSARLWPKNGSPSCLTTACAWNSSARFAMAPTRWRWTSCRFWRVLPPRSHLQSCIWSVTVGSSPPPVLGGLGSYHRRLSRLLRRHRPPRRRKPSPCRKAAVCPSKAHGGTAYRSRLTGSASPLTFPSRFGRPLGSRPPLFQTPDPLISVTLMRERSRLPPSGLPWPLR